MKVVVQRVSEASVSVAGRVVGEIGAGLLVLFCAERGDDTDKADYLARKIAMLRIFDDGGGRMNLSLLDTAGSVLVVSQFTLAAEWRKGNRPGFSRAADPAAGEALYDRFRDRLAAEGVPVEAGEFGAEMDVRLNNAGPVTIVMET